MSAFENNSKDGNSDKSEAAATEPAKARPALEIVASANADKQPSVESQKEAGPTIADGVESRATPTNAPGHAPGDSKTQVTRAASPARVRGFVRRVLMLGGLLAVIIVSSVMWLRGGRIIVTDNAYLRAAKLMVSTDISGIVKSIEIRQGQQVVKDQILFRLDPVQFRIAAESARAQLMRAKLEVLATQRDYVRLQSDIGSQQAIVARAQVAFDRADALVKRRAGSEAAFDQAKFTLQAERKKLDSLRLQADVALTRLGGDAQSSPEKNPQWLEAKARVEEAERQLARTIVRAPFAGVVTAVEALQPGTFLVAQTAALTNTGAVGLVSTTDFWIEANIKETDLTYVRIGNHVDVTVDAYPDRHWRAKVSTIFPATGAEFSILPAQNASGNWVKVVQRVPVRIAIDRKSDDPPLRAGMSVTVHVDTKHQRKMKDLWRLVGLKSDPLPLLSSWLDGLIVPEK